MLSNFRGISGKYSGGQTRSDTPSVVSALEKCCSRVKRKGSNARGNIDSLENIAYVVGISTACLDGFRHLPPRLQH